MRFQEDPLCDRKAVKALSPLFLAVLILALPVSGFARMYEEPRSFSLQDRSLDRVDRKTLKRVDVERLLAEDRRRVKTPLNPGRFRFAVTEDTAFDLNNSGTWQTLPDGRLWRLRIHSPGAVSHNLGITRFALPEGAKLWIYDPARRHVEGPYTSRHRSHRGSLWTPIINGDEIVVELFVPAGASDPVVRIGKVNKGYRSFEEGGTDKVHGSCNVDVICPVGDPWRNEIRSVARYIIGGTGACTGQLMNNTAQDFTPYFLSADHCLATPALAATLVFYWNYEASVCGAQGGGSLADTQSGAIFRASYAPSDFLLVELTLDPDPAFNVFFSGWDATGAAAASTVSISHPRANVKSIAFNTDAVTSTGYLSNTINAAANHWRVDDWESGMVEPGSAGGCLLDADMRCVGQLHGGFSLCSKPNESVWYGKLSVSWNGGGTASTRLQDWLDPGNTGSLAIDGDPHITTLDGTHYDFQGAGEFVALRDASGTEIQVRQAAIATTFFPGPNPHTGLATCVSLNSAVAAQVGAQRVTYQPNLIGPPDPNGLELRVDGVLTTLPPAGIQLVAGRIERTVAPRGIEIVFPDRYSLLVTPKYWVSQSKWYLFLGIFRTPATSGVSGASPDSGTLATGGLGGAIPARSWLPLLPDGSSMGPRPAALQDRYVDLYQIFGEAWRVTDATSLFDYALGTSTDDFTISDWPLENPPCVVPLLPPVSPLSRQAALVACGGIIDIARKENCVFDVIVTGEVGFAELYLLTEQLAARKLCGDGLVNNAPNEQCDDGNQVASNGCNAFCQLECGNSAVEVVEECDDGNTEDGDGCSSICTVENQQSRGQQRCVNVLNRNFLKVAGAQSRENISCIRDASRGRLLGTIHDCLTQDRKGAVAKAQARAVLSAARKCKSPPSFGPNDAAVANAAAVEKEIDLIHDIFGFHTFGVLLEDDVIVEQAVSRDAARCQQAVFRTTNRCQDTLLREFNRCKRTGLRDGTVISRPTLEECLGADPRDRVFRSCDASLGNIRRDIDRRCVSRGVGLSDAFPGCATNDPATLAGCLETLVACRACEALNAVDNLENDCDEFDDGVVNGSCS